MTAKMTTIGSMIFFEADDGIHGDELWRTDGTSNGTVLVKDINPNSANSDPGGFILIGGMLCFSANDGSSGFELWSAEVDSSGKFVAPGHAEVIFN